MKTAEKKELEPDFPYIWKNDYWGWNNWGRTVYSPDLNNVIYPAAEIGKPAPEYVIWDMQNSQTIHSELTGYPSPAPQWAPNAEKYAVVKTGWIGAEPERIVSDLFIVDKETKLVTRTKLAQLFPNNDFEIVYWSWSPDSRTIAFWMDVYPAGFHLLDSSERLKIDSEAQLMILDTLTGEITDTCVKGEAYIEAGGNPDYIHAPIWSPDGKSILVEIGNSMKEQSKLIMIDLENLKGYEIATDTYPFGWMAR